jgi:hypothetical protein
LVLGSIILGLEWRGAGAARFREALATVFSIFWKRKPGNKFRAEKSIPGGFSCHFSTGEWLLYEGKYPEP